MNREAPVAKRKLLDAIEMKDGEAAERASAEHVQAVIRILVDSRSGRNAAGEPVQSDKTARSPAPARQRRQSTPA